jgi:cytochrome bd-type quinol oxidase subunit 1
MAPLEETPSAESPVFSEAACPYGALGFVALESGWMVTELGRQPWIVQGIMRTSAAVSPMPNLMIPFLIMSATYLLLSVIVIWLFVGHIIVSPTPEELNTGSLTGVHHAA